jgi:hypothetical protein
MTAEAEAFDTENAKNGMKTSLLFPCAPCTPWFNL